MEIFHELSQYAREALPVITIVGLMLSPLYKKGGAIRREARELVEETRKQRAEIDALSHLITESAEAVGTVKGGLLSLLRTQLFTTAGRIIERGWSNAKELEELERHYRAYKALGGNGAGETIYEQARRTRRKGEEHDI